MSGRSHAYRSMKLSYATGPTNPFLLSAGSSVQNTDEKACVPERPICTRSGREPMFCPGAVMRISLGVVRFGLLNTRTSTRPLA